MIARVRKNDTVFVHSGKDKGKKGTVLEVLPRENKVMVKGVALATHHIKARKQGGISGIKKDESYVDLSKVMPVCSACKKPCRIKTQYVNSKKVRVCHHCNEAF